MKKQVYPRSGVGRFSANGFTLIEVMIVVAIIGILAAIALPAYNDYVRRGQVQEAFGFLSDYRAKLEQYYQDNRNYGSSTACAVDPTANTWNNFAPTKYFTFRCLTNTDPGDTTQQSYTLTATGSGGAALGNDYTINQKGDRATTKFKGGTVTAPCWLTKASTC